ncbi:hypothetical protein N431DRAFT_533059 [Stipitochalara longipes BDJ]|nr:hypothetical protein N431DRAFT_533059 [Stipitochalara longipes BDJ]
MRSFAVLPAIAALASVVLAAPSLYIRDDPKEINIVVQVLKETSETDIAVIDKATSEIVGYACSSTLKSGSFASFPISANIDPTGAGTLTIGSITYQVHEDPSISGGITCARLYTNTELYLNCAAAVPFTFQLTSANKRDSSACFKNGSPTLHLAANSILTNIETPGPEAGNLTTREAEANPVDKRQGACGVWTPDTQRVGNGNPHQNYYAKQLSQNIECGNAPSCSVGQSQSVSYTLGWSASATADEWLSGGFDVSVSWSTGDTYTCTGASHDTVCVWYNTHFTSYTVQNGMLNQCTGWQSTGGTFTMYSPNAHNAGGQDYYCVIGSCRSQGQGYWGYNIAAGGPP